MKAFSIIWAALALVCFIGVLTGATHHWITTLGSAVMCVAMWPSEDNDHEQRQ